ncbi:MAG: hypothetical protein ABID63_07700 [Pseudomonadota bacterium]
MSTHYAFYAGILRFVAQKTTTDDPEIRVMMAHLTGIASAIEQSGRFGIARDACENVARAFAGVAKFLQERILPEALADGNQGAVKQLTWAIETSLLMAAELVKRINHDDFAGQDSFVLDLPRPPQTAMN